MTVMGEPGTARAKSGSVEGSVHVSVHERLGSRWKPQWKRGCPWMIVDTRVSVRLQSRSSEQCPNMECAVEKPIEVCVVKGGTRASSMRCAECAISRNPDQRAVPCAVPCVRARQGVSPGVYHLSINYKDEVALCSFPSTI